MKGECEADSEYFTTRAVRFQQESDSLPFGESRQMTAATQTGFLNTGVASQTCLQLVKANLTKCPATL